MGVGVQINCELPKVRQKLISREYTISEAPVVNFSGSSGLQQMSGEKKLGNEEGKTGNCLLNFAFCLFQIITRLTEATLCKTSTSINLLLDERNLLGISFPHPI